MGTRTKRPQTQRLYFDGLTKNNASLNESWIDAMYPNYVYGILTNLKHACFFSWNSS